MHDTVQGMCYLLYGFQSEKSGPEKNLNMYIKMLLFLIIKAARTTVKLGCITKLFMETLVGSDTESCLN